MASLVCGANVCVRREHGRVESGQWNHTSITQYSSKCEIWRVYVGPHTAVTCHMSIIKVDYLNRAPERTL